MEATAEEGTIKPQLILLKVRSHGVSMAAGEEEGQQHFMSAIKEPAAEEDIIISDDRVDQDVFFLKAIGSICRLVDIPEDNILPPDVSAHISSALLHEKKSIPPGLSDLSDPYFTLEQWATIVEWRYSVLDNVLKKLQEDPKNLVETLLEEKGKLERRTLL